MKQLLLTAFALVAGMTLSRAQGTFSLQAGKGTVITNGTIIGQGTGNAYSGLGSYYYELLDMPATTWNGLTSEQQSEAYNLVDGFYGFGGSGLSLWTDSGISGVNAGQLTTGGITGEGGLLGTTAANWVAPTSNTGYNTAPGYDYYTVVGWSADLGTTWGAVSNSVVTQSFGVFSPEGWFGQTGVAYNYAGGGPGNLYPPDAFASAAFTGLAGSGLPGSAGALVLYPYAVLIPEPATLALVGLGGISMLFLRRRKT